MNQASTLPVATMRSSTSVEGLNRDCFCVTLDRNILAGVFNQEVPVGDALLSERPHLFADVPAFVPNADLGAMLRTVSAIESVAALPTYQSQATERAPVIASTDHGPRGAFMGYDFHIAASGPALIEINTNAGGAFLNALLMRAQRACCPEVADTVDGALADGFEAATLAMFRAEWKAQRGDAELRRIAIVDEQPQGQYLYPEFLLAQAMFRRAGIDTLIVGPDALTFDGMQLYADGQPVDLVYNRLVDFYFAEGKNAALSAAYAQGAVVVTPNPRHHALFADKHNLTVLSDPNRLAALGLPASAIANLASVPRTIGVSRDNAESLWATRRAWFFKPVAGHGGKAVYRGDKLTRGAWKTILDGCYVAQTFATPGSRTIRRDGEKTDCKMDVRLYTYDGRLLLMAARLYQGQTTNFRTTGGGFAPVFVV